MTENAPAARDVYYIAAHHKPYQLRWLLTAVYNEHDHFLLHVDASIPAEVAAEIHAVAAEFPRVVLVPRRSVQWGTWSQVGAELSVLEIAAGLGDWRYFITLSAQDYPLVPIDELRTRLDASYPRSWIRVWSFEEVAAVEPDDPHLRRRVEVPVGGRLVVLPVRVRRPGDLDLDYKGASWHMLSRPFCDWVLTDPAARRIAGILKFSTLPDETYFQAAIMNSPFAEERMPDSGRFVIWPGPKTLTRDDLDALRATDDVFARKFDADVDAVVLGALAERSGYTAPDENGSGSA